MHKSDPETLLQVARALIRDYEAQVALAIYTGASGHPDEARLAHHKSFAITNSIGQLMHQARGENPDTPLPPEEQLKRFAAIVDDAAMTCGLRP